jgi:eukaryotic-like serine/threonine-protein kinase
VKLVDFGAAQLDDSHPAKSGLVIGTLAYMSPEQLRAEPVDARTDLYAVAATLYEAATGTRLNNMKAVWREPLDSLPTRICDEALERAILRGLAHERTARFASAAEFVRALQADCKPRVTPLGKASGASVVEGVGRACAGGRA